MRKIAKLLSTVLIVALILSVAMVQAFALTPDDAYISGDGVNFRSGPGTAYAVKGAYCTGTPLTVIHEYDTGWCEVSIYGARGFVYGAYVTRGYYPTDAVPLEINYYHNGKGELGVEGYINTQGVNFRIAPGAGYASLGVLDKGTEVVVTEYLANGWYGVYINGYPGFVYGDYVTEGTYSTASDLITSTDLGDVPGYINVDGVNVRSAPTTSATAIATLKRGYEVIMHASYSNDWLGIFFKDAKGNMLSGYVYAPYVTAGSFLSEILFPSIPYVSHGYINYPNAEFRVAPSDAYAAACYLPIGTELDIVEKYETANYYGVIAGNGAKGFVYIPYLTEGNYNVNDPSIAVNTEAAPVITDNINLNGKINTNNTPIYVAPDASYSIISYLSAGTDVFVLDRYSNGWYGIIVNGNPGFVYGSYVTLP